MKNLLRWIPALGYAALIAALSSSPHPLPVELPYAGIDKLLHAIAYALLALLVRWPLSAMSVPAAIAPRLDLVAVAGAGLYGLTDELHQSFVPGRSADPLDVLADCAGALLGIALWHGAGRWRRWRQSHAA